MGIRSTVKDILSKKQIDGALVIDPSASVFEALEAMARFNVGALLVVEDEQLLGIISERDYSRKVVLNSQSSKTVPVSDIMQTKTHHVTYYDTAEHCLSLMNEKRARHLPVFDSGDIVGVVSMGDIVQAVLGDNEFMIDQLTRYVTDSFVVQHPPGW